MTREGFREIGIFVTGATPQIVTETIYALAQRRPAIHLDTVRIITTSEGRKRITETLVEKGILDDLCREYGLPHIALNDDSFVIVKGRDGRDLPDIRDDADNEAIGDLITSFIRAQAADPSARLHCSLAGGRKTMSFYLGAALQLFGRPWDRLYHVLVTPEFESNRDFFYKPKRNRIIDCPLPGSEVKKLHTKDAEIRLAELPFIRLGRKFTLPGKGFGELVREGQREIDIATVQPEVRINLADRTITMAEVAVELKPVQLTLYMAFIRLKTARCKFPERPYCLDCTACFPTVADLAAPQMLEAMAEDYVASYRGNPYKKEELLEKWRDDQGALKGMDQGAIRSYITKINNEFKEQCPDNTLRAFIEITRLKQYGMTRYGVRVEKGKIAIE